MLYEDGGQSGLGSDEDSKNHKAAGLLFAEMSGCLKGRRSDGGCYFPGGYKSHLDVGRGIEEAFLFRIHQLKYIFYVLTQSILNCGRNLRTLVFRALCLT